MTILTGPRAAWKPETVAPAGSEEYSVDWDTSAAEKGGYQFFMDKEIAEQPQAMRETLGGRLRANAGPYELTVAW